LLRPGNMYDAQFSNVCLGQFSRGPHGSDGPTTAGCGFAGLPEEQHNSGKRETARFARCISRFCNAVDDGGGIATGAGGRIWTPSWTIFSGGICFLFLAAFAWVIEVKGVKKWTFPLIVIGMNSIAAYCIAHLLEGFLEISLRIHLGANFFQFAGAGLEPFFRGATILLCYWLILLWMFRRKLFLKI